MRKLLDPDAWLAALPKPIGTCWPSPNSYERHWAKSSDFLRGKDEKPLDPTK